MIRRRRTQLEFLQGEVVPGWNPRTLGRISFSGLNSTWSMREDLGLSFHCVCADGNSAVNSYFDWNLHRLGPVVAYSDIGLSEIVKTLILRFPVNFKVWFVRRRWRVRWCFLDVGWVAFCVRIGLRRFIHRSRQRPIRLLHLHLGWTLRSVLHWCIDVSQWL